MSRMALIAVVEDDPEIRSLVRELLAREGFEAVACASARDLDRVIAQRHVDLVVLDLMLPGEDGLSVCRRLRSSETDTAVLMVTAKGEDVDRIVGLELGADDYLPKPFNPRELVARVRSILRRSQNGQQRVRPQPETFSFAGWMLNAGSRSLSAPDGQMIELTGAEFDLLMIFLTHPQRVLNRDQLLDWTRRRQHEPFDRTIDVQLSRLRRKLRDNPKAAAMIRTIRGGGYLFAPAVACGRA